MTSQPTTSNQLAVVDQAKPNSLSIFSDMDAFERAQRAAKLLAESKFVPQAFQGRVADCTVALEMAGRMRISPIAVMQSLHIIHGKPSFESKFLIGLINSSGRYAKPLRFKYSGTGDTRSCIVIAVEHDGEVIEGPEVSIKMAKAEGWYGKSGSKWPNMPDQMLAYRAASFFANLYTPELKLGMPTNDELVDVTPSEDGTPQASAVEGLNSKIKGRRAKKAAPVIEHEPAAEEAKAAEVLPPEIVVDAEPVAEPEPEPAKPARPEPKPVNGGGEGFF